MLNTADFLPSNASFRHKIDFFFGPGAKVLVKREAEAFGTPVFVVDQPRGSDIHRYLSSINQNGIVAHQSVMSLARPWKLLFDYERLMSLAFGLVEAPRSALLLGLGGGAMARFARHRFPKCDLTIVEREKTIIELAQRHFRMTYPVIEADAIQYVEQNEMRFDVVMVDLYDAGGFHEGGLSGKAKSFWRNAMRALAEGGCLAVNFADLSDGKSYRAISSYLAKLSSTSCCVAPRGFKDNVIQFCMTGAAVDPQQALNRLDGVRKLQSHSKLLEQCDIMEKMG